MEESKKAKHVTRFQGYVIILILLAGSGLPFWDMFKPVQQWEYRMESIASGASSKFSSPSIILESSDLKNIGDEGWELVDIFEEVETVHPNFGDEDYVTGIRTNTRTQKVTFLFKRPKKFYNQMQE